MKVSKLVVITIVLVAALVAITLHNSTVSASAKVPEITKKSFVGQTADLSFTFNTPVNHGADYRVSVYADQTGGSGNVTIDYDDDLHHNQFFTGLSTQFQNAQSTKSIFILHSAPGTPIVFAVNNSQVNGPATYNLYITIEEL